MNAYQSEIFGQQAQRNRQLLAQSERLAKDIQYAKLPFQIDISAVEDLVQAQIDTLEALQIKAARIAVASVAELAAINEFGCLGGGLEIIPALSLTMSFSDHEQIGYTIEHAHTAVGYYALLSAYGCLEPAEVVQKFRRGVELPGHVAWLAGGTQLSGGRLGVIIPMAVGEALGKRAHYGKDSWVVVHCGDAGWISGQALNGFNIAKQHGAPISFVMHRNGLQHSGPTRKVIDADPRKIISALGLEILEIKSLHDLPALYRACREAFTLAQAGRPALIYPSGYTSGKEGKVTLRTFSELTGLEQETRTFAEKHLVSLEQEIWIPGSLMSYRDSKAMLECLFLVNELRGGRSHHDGDMKGRNLECVLNGPLMQFSAHHRESLQRLRQGPPLMRCVTARPETGSENLRLAGEMAAEAELPSAGSQASPRAGCEAAYELIARRYPETLYVISCDLDKSTKLQRAAALLDAHHHFEVGIEEQAAAILANGLALSEPQKKLVVVSSFAAFFEGIAREGFESWRYQRNLTGRNEGLNVTYHLSHVGACTGRDHFSGWGLDWINLGLTYLPYLDRFYTPADARSAFVAVLDLASRYGGHIIGVPRVELPVLTLQGCAKPLWNAETKWEAITALRRYPKARRAVLAVGACAGCAIDAVETLQNSGMPADAYVINGFPLPAHALPELFDRYGAGVVTLEDGLIGDRQSGLRGFAGLAAGEAEKAGTRHLHLGITDPCVAPSDGYPPIWNHFGLSAAHALEALAMLSAEKPLVGAEIC